MTGGWLCIRLLQRAPRKQLPTIWSFVGKSLKCFCETSSLEKVQSLMAAATQAGASGVSDLSRTGASGRHANNVSRDLLRLLLKSKDMPSLYWAKVPLHCSATEQSQEIELPFLLPHEMFHKVCSKIGSPRELKSDMDPCLQELLSDCCSQLRTSPTEVIPLGLHGDGVPHQKHGSIECFNWNFQVCPLRNAS